MQEEALERLSKGDPAKAERLTALAWKVPKQSHKKLMYRVLQCAIPLIFCLRAEPKIRFVKDANGKMQVVDAGWQPITEKMFGYEMLVYALLMPDNPGVPTHLKKLEPDLDPVFVTDQQIDEATGQRLAAWAAGGTAKQAPTPDDAVYITADQALVLEARCTENGIDIKRLKLAAKVERLSQIKVADFQRAEDWIMRAIEATKART